MGGDRGGRSRPAEGQLGQHAKPQFINVSSLGFQVHLARICSYLLPQTCFLPLSPPSPLQVFEEVSALVVSVLDGFNVSIMAYGESSPSLRRPAFGAHHSLMSTVSHPPYLATPLSRPPLLHSPLRSNRVRQDAHDGGARHRPGRQLTRTQRAVQVGGVGWEECRGCGEAGSLAPTKYGQRDGRLQVLERAPLPSLTIGWPIPGAPPPPPLPLLPSSKGDPAPFPSFAFLSFLPHRVAQERADDFEYSFKASILEIYNEQVREQLTA